MWKFKARVLDVCDSTPYNRDIDLLSWLVARSFDLDCAVDMMRKSMAWRERHGVNRILDEWEPPAALLEFFPRGYDGKSKAGLPLFIGCLGQFDIRGLIRSCRKTDFIKFALYCFETGGRHVLNISRETGVPVNQFLLLFDLEGLSVAQVAYKEGFELFLEMTRIMEANYPEGLGVCMVINAPPVFTLAWSMIRPLLRGTTQSKIQIFGHTGWQQRLLELVEPDQLPKHWGGSLIGPDGNPHNRPTVCIGGEVPSSFFQDPHEMEKLAAHGRKLHVRRAGKKEYRIDVAKLKTQISWRFCTKGYDILFGVYRESNAGNDELVIKERVYSHLVVESGKLVCSDPGVYILEFDNSYSYFHGKEVYLDVVVV
ncbi:SEC14-like protein 2 [Pollicipes pollicipes]|uniref:SEC14-like protein 2 n=1 Tax=Pollicipes pollicipes TaxID=41117 RepID=UPI0018849B8B|nr:SEC14-like protein 2 [Pollicipes pollicipes]